MSRGDLWLGGNGLRKHSEPFRLAIEDEHHCTAEFLVSMPIAVAAGRAAWHGMVDAFLLHNHPSATSCYAWSNEHGQPVTQLKETGFRTAEEAVQKWLAQVTRAPLLAQPQS